jgi:LysM repeat protein
VTYFNDPHFLGGQVAVNQPSSGPSTPAHVGIPVTPITLIQNLLSAIPYPPVPTSGSVPQPYPYVVIVNSSPFSLAVAQGGTLTQIAAYTQDVVKIPNPDPLAPVTILPTPGAANIAPGVDHTVYATWYPSDPGGQYPAAIGAGTIPIGTSSILATVDFAGAIGGAITPVVLPWVQAIAIRGNSGGGAIAAANVIVTDSNGTLLCETILHSGLTLYVPVQGDPSPTITITAQGTAVLGVWHVYGLVGPVINPYIATVGGGSGFATSTGPQQGIAPTILAGAITALIAPPEYGYMLRIRTVSFQPIAAPAAGATVALRATNSALYLMRHQLAATINDVPSPFPCDIWVPDSQGTGVNVPDGLTAQNASGVNVLFAVQYEVWPTPLAPI